MRAHNRGQATLEQALVLAAVVTGLLGAHMYMRRAYMGRIHSLGNTFGDTYVPRATTRNQTLSLKLQETTQGTSTYDATDPSKQRITILTSTVQDETKLTGTETVSDNTSKKLLDP